MAELFTQEQARAWLRKNNLKTGKSIQDAFINEIKGVLQEALEEEMNNTLGYSKYDYTNKNTDNSRNGHTKKTVKSQFGKIELHWSSVKNFPFIYRSMNLLQESLAAIHF